MSGSRWTMQAFFRTGLPLLRTVRNRIPGPARALPTLATVALAACILFWPEAQARGQAGQYSFTTLAGMPGGRGNADGVGSAAGFTAPAGVAVDSVQNAYVADTANHTIRKVSPSGVVTTLAGSAGQAGAVDGSASIAR